jgi:hypothetical protein
MGGTSSQTPLSDLIGAYFEARTPDSLARLLEAFQSARVGVIEQAIQFSGEPREPVGEEAEEDSDE